MANHSIPTVICEGGQDNAHCSDGTGYGDLKNMSLRHDTTDANRAVLECDIRMAFYGDAVPFSTRNIGWWGQKIDDLGTREIGQRINTMVHGSNYSFDQTWYNEPYRILATTTKITFRGYFTFNKAAANWMYIAFYETLPNTLKITSPRGLSGSFPTVVTGNISGSITAWGLGSPTPMSGTPTTYPGAKSWNWSVELLDEYGSVVARKLYNTGETKSCSFGAGDSGWYTANALAGSASANATPYEMQAGKKYRFRITVSNDYNQTASTTSGWYYAAPPEPTVTITSIIYNPTLKKSEMCFDWSLAKSGLTPETLTYEATLPDGTVVASGTIKTITNGAADSGTECGIQVPTGDEITLTVKNVAGTDPNQMTSTGTAKEFSPVANAAFLGFDWDGLRRTCTIRAEAPGAANCRIEAGYQANVFDVGDKLTSGEIGELVVKDLDHGSGQILYLQATPESSSGHKYENEIAKISIPIPNPILGVYTPKCGSTAKQQYIVDIVEKKKDCSLTPKWQNGDRVVVVDKCPAVKKGDFGTLYYKDGADTIAVPIKDENEFNALGSESGDIQVGGVSIDRFDVTAYDFGVDVTDIPDYFLNQCPNLATVSGMEKATITSIGNRFVANSAGNISNMNFNLVLTNDLTAIGDYFLYNCQGFNSPVTIPTSVTIIGNNFLTAAVRFNSSVTLHDGITSIGRSFLGSTQFNQTLTLPASLESIGSEFLISAKAFVQPLTLPDSITSVGSNFMTDCDNFIGPLNVGAGTGHPTDYISLGSYSWKPPMAQTGVTLVGTNKQIWKDALPDNSYRKLLLGA